MALQVILDEIERSPILSIVKLNKNEINNHCCPNISKMISSNT